MAAAKGLMYLAALFLLLPSELVKANQCKTVSYSYCCELGTPCDCKKGTTSSGQCKPESYAFCCSIGTPCDCTQPPEQPKPSSSNMSFPTRAEPATDEPAAVVV